LKIPGARIDAAYAQNNRLDPAWYDVDCEEGLIRWGHDSARPHQITVAVMLDKPLLAEDVGPRWKKLDIVVPVLVALLGLFGVIWSAFKPEPPAAPQTPKPVNYTVSGTLNLRSGADILVCIDPPSVNVYEDQQKGHLHFYAQVPFTVDAHGNLTNIPHLLIQSRRPEYRSITVPIGKTPLHGTDYGFRKDPDLPLIYFDNLIELPRADDGPYDAATSQQPQRVRGPGSPGTGG
jgi:hypothetical protein